MIFYFFFINKTLLQLAAEKGFVEIVDLLLAQDGIDINCKTIRISNSF